MAIATTRAASPLRWRSSTGACVMMVTADHGNDPTTPSTDHSRERVPFLVSGPSVRAGVNLGTRGSFADVAATVAELLGVAWDGAGESFARTILD
jgi:phosphopentomutase